MKTFWDLPKPVREKIYRLHLVAEEQPVDFAAYNKTCGYTENADYMERDKKKKPAKLKCPDSLRVSRKMEREASPIYFGENTFCIWAPEELSVWNRFTVPRHFKPIRKVAIWAWTILEGGPADAAFKAMNTLPNLESLTFELEEEEGLRAKLTCRQHRPAHRILSWHESLGFGSQVNLQLLRLHGMDGLRSLRGLREFKFVKDLEVSSDDPSNVGSIPGGFFETVVKKEIMQPRSPKTIPWRANGAFRFLDLPPELRNIIYGMLLIFPGPTYPLAEKPLSVTSRFKFRKQAQRDALHVPSSALEILQVNKQVHDEAHKLFYQNDLVFSSSVEIQDFLCSLGDGRLDSLRSLTLFYRQSMINFDRRGMDVHEGLGATLPLIRRLKGIQKLHLLLRFRNIEDFMRRYTVTGNFADDLDVSRLKDAKVLFTLRGVADIEIRDLDLLEVEDRFNDLLAAKPVQDHWNVRCKKHITRQMAALRHFNHGLQLAQAGVVVRELYTDVGWRKKETWPVLQGSDCGLRKGCSCGVEKASPEEVIEISDDSD